ncbi:Zinc-binding domain of primase-helicase [Fulvimarina manganoxydans]|uniref:Zinc-binding domain of primase-helicase n=1 Tax=Fulvimarina manganoxydans TaxID=937218 RepID=A0A1W2EKM2_9HYPH|nr:primase-helicase zinc-binding domain-containing protein [Fulvimarina manganoxydans]SMD10165.1 Zinc-binding domain of primase-helicase [Fulvimarina manganoxydans]
MSAATDLFIETARGASIASVVPALGLTGLKRIGTGEEAGPCPIAGGRDGFAINTAKNSWVCRKCGDGGRDAIGLAAHVAGLDVKRRADFLEACSMVTGEAVPEDEALSDERRAELAKAREERQAAAEREVARREAEQNRFREREWARCVGDWKAAGPLTGSPAAAYLTARGLALPDPVYARCHPNLPYWFGQGKAAQVLHRGPALLVMFVRPAGDAWQPIGLHRTWIDLSNGPKFRPFIIDPETGEALATKKMRGTKAGGLLPIAGRYSTAIRMVGGEGIESVIGFAMREADETGVFRDDTFYFAAGDLGNLAGRSVDRMRHPSLVKPDRKGRKRPVFVPGEEPDLSSPAAPIPDHVDELVLLGDGDSEPVFTRSAMVRACHRHAQDGRTVRAVIADRGFDWAENGADPAWPLPVPTGEVHSCPR